MRVFISWSGGKSKAVAVALSEWLPNVIQNAKPFVSEGVAAGARWLNEIDQELEGTNFAIVCVTRENQSSAWLNFEAGAVAKGITASRVVPLAIDLTVADVKPPLGNFQAKDISKAGILAVLKSLNEHAETPVPNLAAACDRWWPDLEPELEAAKIAASLVSAPVRSERELIEEVLATVRGLGEQAASLTVARDQMQTVEARAAAAMHQAEAFQMDALTAHATLREAQDELAARRAHDLAIGDRALREVIKIVRGGGLVTDDHRQPRLDVSPAAGITDDEREEARKRAARFGFYVVFTDQQDDDDPD